MNSPSKVFIQGNLITGEAGAGKTTVLAHLINNQLYYNPGWKLRALARKEEKLFERLRPESRAADKHSLVETNGRDEPDFITETLFNWIEKAEATGEQIILALDEINLKSHDLAEKLINLGKIGSSPIQILLTTQNLKSAAASFGEDFAYNFAFYTILRNSRRETFYAEFGIDTNAIPGGQSISLQKDGKIGDGYEVVPGFSFTANDLR